MLSRLNHAPPRCFSAGPLVALKKSNLFSVASDIVYIQTLILITLNCISVNL